MLLDEATASIDADSTRGIYQKLPMVQQCDSEPFVDTAHHANFPAAMVDRHFHLVDG
jgi:energy-coupling factor transporter ATP-binding protein EcfA2